jgi:TPR repeat protein
MKHDLSAVVRSTLLPALAAGALLLAGCAAPAGGSAAKTDNVEALKTAANGGDADAAFKLGEIYKNGRGVAKNNVEAENWYKKAKELYDKK